MGLNNIAWKRVQRVNRELGERFVHASTSSHGEWWVWGMVRHDGTSVLYDTRTGELDAVDTLHTSTERLLRTRMPYEHSRGWEEPWLAELDARSASLTDATPAGS